MMMIVVPTLSPIEQAKQPMIGAVIFCVVIAIAPFVIDPIECTSHAPGDSHGC